MLRKYGWLALLVYVLDQLTKLAAVQFLVYHAELKLLPFLNLTLVFNTGAAFGFLGDASGWQNAFFITVALVAAGIIVAMLRRLRPSDVWSAVALTLILGGAIGNLTDRLLHGYVIDFIDVHYAGWHWPAFNVADSAITIGAIVLIVDALGWTRRRT